MFQILKFVDSRKSRKIDEGSLQMKKGLYSFSDYLNSSHAEDVLSKSLNLNPTAWWGKKISGKVEI